jgi:tRNA pseudouridine38-40 synthase
MLHQIRKMVGTLMAVCRGQVGPDYITKALNPSEVVYLPTAPGLGLLLEQVNCATEFVIMCWYS